MPISKKGKELQECGSIIVEQYSSFIRRPQYQRVQLKSLGLGRIGSRRELPNIPCITGLVKRLSHLVRIVGNG
ncbi:MAG: 50S ribosomal protein L30 [Holosporales bacterium]|jgi:large subunit ribosomal protein L30|nr:50S ribosomal protein L30 [Holosporales bacterium]